MQDLSQCDQLILSLNAQYLSLRKIAAVCTDVGFPITYHTVKRALLRLQKQGYQVVFMSRAEAARRQWTPTARQKLSESSKRNHTDEAVQLRRQRRSYLEKLRHCEIPVAERHRMADNFFPLKEG